MTRSKTNLTPSHPKPKALTSFKDDTVQDVDRATLDSHEAQSSHLLSSSDSDDEVVPLIDLRKPRYVKASVTGKKSIRKNGGSSKEKSVGSTKKGSKRSRPTSSTPSRTAQPTLQPIDESQKMIWWFRVQTEKKRMEMEQRKMEEELEREKFLTLQEYYGTEILRMEMEKKKQSFQN